MNKCKTCEYQFYCMGFRYKNKRKSYMKRIKRKPNSTGDIVIWVRECTKFTPYRPKPGAIFRTFKKSYKDWYL